MFVGLDELFVKQDSPHTMKQLVFTVGFETGIRWKTSLLTNEILERVRELKTGREWSADNIFQKKWTATH